MRKQQSKGYNSKQNHQNHAVEYVIKGSQKQESSTNADTKIIQQKQYQEKESNMHQNLNSQVLLAQHQSSQNQNKLKIDQIEDIHNQNQDQKQFIQQNSKSQAQYAFEFDQTESQSLDPCKQFKKGENKKRGFRNQERKQQDLVFEKQQQIVECIGQQVPTIISKNQEKNHQQIQYQQQQQSQIKQIQKQDPQQTGKMDRYGFFPNPKEILHENDQQVNFLTENLIEKLKSSNLECMICFDLIFKQAPIWSCQQCHQPFHMSCLKQWIFNSNKNKPKEQKEYAWTCPKCNYHYSEPLPVYVCFCGKQENPEASSFTLPHSCGNICERKRGANCPHLCPLPCHPGLCPPCNIARSTVHCFCKKNSITVKCSQDITSFECGKQCEKVLNCGVHHCDRECHAGTCGHCQVLQLISCYCGKRESNQLCGMKGYSCQSQCGKQLDCKNHTCKQLCHSGPCQQCKLSPGQISTCWCGKTQLQTLIGNLKRNSCADPLPVCGLPCKKILKCRQHPCQLSCHEGECPPCKIKVEQHCRCNQSTRFIECFKINESDFNKEEFLCHKMCKKVKSCNYHKCDVECCAYKNVANFKDTDGAHLCLKICNKKLKCGNHNCADFCHIGFCKPCPIYLNEPLTCTCGETAINPPVPCGSKLPECNKPCKKVSKCGHGCISQCHEGPCPPCQILTNKQCRCGKEMIQDNICFQTAFCNTPCMETLLCGHQCKVICHNGECPGNIQLQESMSCGKKCGKLRKTCEHKCQEKCHYKNACPEHQPCQVQVKISCQCKHRSAFVSCSNISKMKLPCDSSCHNMSRFGSMFQRSEKEAKQKPYYPQLLVNFAQKNQDFIEKVESQIENMVKKGDPHIDILINDSLKKAVLQIYLSNHYCADIDVYQQADRPFITVHNTNKLKIPMTKLSKYRKLIIQGKILPDIMPFEVTYRFTNPINRQDSIEELEYLLKDFHDAYYFERSNEKAFLLHFWDLETGRAAAKKLKKSSTSFSQFGEEVNEQARKENMQLECMKDDVIIKEFPALALSIDKKEIQIKSINDMKH